MIVRVRLFAAARELAGKSEEMLEVRDAATLADVERALLNEFPALKSLLSHARWAVDAEFAMSSAVVTERSEIALIPPVSGG